MSDLDDAAAKLATKATLRAARDAASKALDDALLTDEERARREEADAAAAKRKLKKRIAIGVVGLLLLLGVVGLVINYWQWFLLAGLVGLAGLYGRYRWRKRRGEKQVAAEEKARPRKAAAPSRVAVPPTRIAVRTDPEADAKEIEDELAALKARVKR